jgi:hypothetical protein
VLVSVSLARAARYTRLREGEGNGHASSACTELGIIRFLHYSAPHSQVIVSMPAARVLYYTCGCVKRSLKGQ